MIPDPANPHRLPAPSPCISCTLSKVGWFTALAAALLAAFLFFRQMSLTAQIKVEANNAALAQTEIKALKQQLFAERILAERQLANLSNNATKSETIILAHLTPPDSNATTPTALALWLPSRQSGILFAEQLPPPRDDEELRLWLEEPNSSPVSAGTINVGPGSASKTEFKPAKPLGLTVRFTVTRESKGHTGAPSGPILLSGAP